LPDEVPAPDFRIHEMLGPLAGQELQHLPGRAIFASAG
jgi:hypothetical protein